MKKAIALLLGLIILSGVVAYIAIDEPLPEGQAGEKADALALQILEAIQAEAWENTGAVTWRFPGNHHYIWDKKRHFVLAEWEQNRVLFDVKTKKGIAYTAGQKVDKENNDALVEEAWKIWVNDSFWLNAPAKVFDAGTRRALVEAEGRQALLVTYTSGGVTPGDSYLWILNEDNLPIKWKMWVSIIPIGGIEFTWEDWQTTQTGAYIATLHANPLFSIEITDLETADTLEALTGGTDPFQELIELTQ